MESQMMYKESISQIVDLPKTLAGLRRCQYQVNVNVILVNVVHRAKPHFTDKSNSCLHWMEVECADYSVLRQEIPKKLDSSPTLPLEELVNSIMAA